MQIVEIKEVEVSKLQLHPENQKYFENMTGELWEIFKEDIRNNGVTSPITVNKKNGYVVKGNQRVRALKELGIEKVHCLIVRYESEDEEIDELIRDNALRREPDIFTKMKLVNELASRFPERKRGRKTEKEKQEINSVNNAQKLPPRDQIAKLIKENSKFISLSNIFNSLPNEVQSNIKKWYQENDNPTKKALNEKIRLEKKLEEEVRKNIESAKQIAEKNRSLKKYHDMDYDISQIEEKKKQIEALEEKHMELFKDSESTKRIHRALIEGREFFKKQCIDIPYLELTERSLSSMAPEIKELISLVSDWLIAMKSKFVEAENG